MPDSAPPSIVPRPNFQLSNKRLLLRRYSVVTPMRVSDAAAGCGGTSTNPRQGNQGREAIRGRRKDEPSHQSRGRTAPARRYANAELLHRYLRQPRSGRSEGQPRGKYRRRPLTPRRTEGFCAYTYPTDSGGTL